MSFETSLNHRFSEITNDFWFKLEKFMIEIGLHSGQVFVLFSLWQADGQSQVEIAKKLRLTPPTVNKMIKSLAKKGFIHSRRDKKDARIVRVFLTEKGSKIQTRVEDQWKRLEDEFFSTLTETEKLILSQIFDKLKENRDREVETGSA